MDDGTINDFRKNELKINQIFGSERVGELLKQFPTLRSMAERLKTYSHEYHSKVFYIMVIGPTKSGKSTLVNLLARQEVSPMDVRECTIRPSFVYSESDPNQQVIQLYKKKETSQLAKDDCLDLMITHLQNIDSKEAFQENLEVESRPMEQLREVIVSKKYKYDNQIITTVPTAAKEGLLYLPPESASAAHDKIILVDMPGFDGAEANRQSKEEGDRYLYKAMVERANMIIFVQSSVSAITKNFVDFFNAYKASNNNEVAIHLVSNAYESKLWRTTDNHDEIVRQEQEAFQKIYKQGIPIRESHVVSLNLGKVYDALFHPENILPQFSDDLSAEKARFLSWEEELKAELVNTKDISAEMYENRLRKAADQLNEELKRIYESEMSKRALQKQFDSACKSFLNELHLLGQDNEQDAIKKIVGIFAEEIKRKYNFITNGSKASYQETMAMMQDAMDKGAQQSQEVFNEFSKRMYNEIRSKLLTYTQQESTFSHLPTHLFERPNFQVNVDYHKADQAAHSSSWFTLLTDAPKLPASTDSTTEQTDDDLLITFDFSDIQYLLPKERKLLIFPKNYSVKEQKLKLEALLANFVKPTDGSIGHMSTDEPTPSMAAFLQKQLTDIKRVLLQRVQQLLEHHGKVVGSNAEVIDTLKELNTQMGELKL